NFTVIAHEIEPCVLRNYAMLSVATLAEIRKFYCAHRHCADTIDFDFCFYQHLCFGMGEHERVDRFHRTIIDNNLETGFQVFTERLADPAAEDCSEIAYASIADPVCLR